MEGRFAVPFHFASEFVVLVVAVGACLDALRARKYGAGLWSIVQALAFALLAAAQIAHGSLIASEDGGNQVVFLRAASFALLALVARPAASVLPAVALAPAALPALFFPGPDARLALAPAAAAMVVAGRGVLAHRRDQDPATFAFAGAFLMFAAGEGAIAFAPATGGALLVASHASRALGALFLARWLWSSVGRSVRMRTVAAFVVVLVVGVLVVSGAINLVIGDTLQTEDLKRLSSAGNTRIAAINQLESFAVGTSTSLGDDARLIRTIESGSKPQGFLSFARLLPPQASFLIAFDRTGRVMGSAEQETGTAAPHRLLLAEEASIAGTQVITDVLSGLAVSSSAVPLSFTLPNGKELSEVVVVAASSVRSGRTRAGAVAVGYRLDRSYLQRVREETGIDACADNQPSCAPTANELPAGGVTLLVGEPFRISAKTFPDASITESVALAALNDGAERARAAALAGSLDPVVTSLVRLGSDIYATAFVPISNPQEVIGVMALSRRTSALENAQRDITKTLFLVTLLAVAIAALLAWLSGGRVTRPIRSLTSAARELREGHLDARARVTSVDEVGTLGTAFNEMAQELQRTTSGLRDAATAEASLRGRMEAIVQSMGDALIATDAEARIVTFNRAAEQMLGKKAERAQGRKIADVLEGSVQGGRSLADAAMHVSSAHGVLKGTGRASLTVALTAAPLLDAGGKPAGRVIVLRDVTREQEAERMKSEFLANVSHELRTPITPIKGYAEIMARKQFPREKAMQFLEGILDSTERLERIVEILVDFAAIEAGRLKPRQEAVAVRSLVDASLGRWKQRDTTHRFARHGGADLAPVLGDARLLGRALDELLDNAVKFTPAGGRIEVDAEAFGNGRARAPRKIAITVRDNGPGIEADRLPELFRDFRQLDGSETRAHGGLGLGLAYVKRIMTVHGGEVLVESAPGKGSAFTLVLPIAGERAPAAKHRNAGARVAARKSGSRSKR